MSIEPTALRRDAEDMPTAYEPPILKSRGELTLASSTQTKTTPLQSIARDITRLTWREAEAMGKGIMSKMKGGSDLSGLTAAIQDWSWEWEVFKEEDRPKA